jgi:tetratricopeptide (TPR) repeat protein
VTQLLAYLALAALCIVVISIKVHRTTAQLPYYDPAKGENLHWSESAFHFRHARMISQGKDIPAMDTGIQYPEGLDTRRYITPVMENVYGRLHRWFFSDVPLHHFLVYATAIFSTLSVVACFFAGRELAASAWMGLVCACLYGLALGSLGRNYGAFIREDFALPFLLGSYACFMGCMKKQRWPVAAVGSVLLVVGLASWHVAQFYFQLLFIGFALLVLLYRSEQLPRQTFTIYSGAAFAAAVLLPILRVKYYVASVGLMLSYGVLVVLWLEPRLQRWTRRKVVQTSIPLLAVFAAGGLIIQRATGTHSHVIAVIWAKLRYLGALPSDPTLLPFEARTMWSSAFVSPSANDVFMMLTTLLLFSAMGLIVLLVRGYRRQLTADQAMLLYFALITFVLFLMFRRMMVFAIFFLALLAGMAWPRHIRWRQIAFVALFIACLIFEVGKYFHLHVFPSNPPIAHVADITGFLRTHSKSDEAVLTTIAMGAPVATYANRPVLIHSKFESRTLRNKVKKIYTAFFGDEKTLHELCEAYGARYLVYDSNMALSVGIGSMRYFAGYSVLPTDSVTFLLHFAPEKLDNFHLVHQNTDYRVFLIGQPTDDAPPFLPYEPLYDLGLFTEKYPGKTLTDEQIATGLRRLDSAQALVVQADKLFKAARFPEAIQPLRRSLRIHPRQPFALFILGEALMNIKKYEEAAEVLTKAVKLDPRLEPDYRRQWPHVALVTFAITKNLQGDFVEAEQICRRVLSVEKHSWRAHLYLGISLFNQNRTMEAQRAFREAIRINPKCFQAYEQLGMLYAKRGEYGKAAEAIAQALTFEPEQERLRNMLADFRAKERASSAR